MGFMGAHKDEVGLLGVRAVFHPSDCLLHDGVAIPLPHFADLFAIAYPAVGVFGAVKGVHGSAEPVVEAVVAGVGLTLEIAEVPLANEAGVVALLFEEGGEGDFFLSEMAPFGAGDGVEAGAIGSASGKDAGAGWGAYGTAGVTVGEAHALFGESIEVRGLDDGAPVAGEVSKTEVVGEKEDNVGGLGREKGGGQSDGKREEESHVRLEFSLENWVL